MNPKQSEAAAALRLEFVRDLGYNPRTHQYRIDLIEPYSSELPVGHNYLLIDVEGFTVEALLTLFQREVIAYYEQKVSDARQLLERTRLEVAATANDHTALPDY